MINVILAEGHNIVRIGIRTLLERDGGFKILAEGISGVEAVNYINDGGSDADIVLTDINMPGMGGLELIEKLKEISPKVKVIMFTSLDNEKHISKAFKEGASGYLLKNVSSDELVFSIKHVHEGGRYICSELAFRLLDKLVDMPDLVTLNSSNDFDISAKEQEVLTLISEGFTNQEIADKIFTSKRTVEGYRQALMSKTGSRNTAALIKLAIRTGLIN
ncbi:MAG: response regulator transcription factor [Sphingobacteriaceae bacterium]|nr:MAG: response regulator transcription factor [Sphingobacteriaceae bacterium]